ncbi:MAG: nitrile hydratase beta subunit [Candidatus Azotimanducaceae bacterium]|jgi:nitrile hydratase beta subunit
MDGIHDLGGKHGFGVVDRSGDATVFHSRWEAAVFAMVNAAAQAGAWHNTDQFRHAVERIDPAAYLTQGYYGRWLGGLETLLVESGLLTTAELQARLAQMGGSARDRVAARPAVSTFSLGESAQGSGSQREVGQARFKVGEQVRTLDHSKPTHTRLPAYARGKRGTVSKIHGGWIYPDTNAQGQGECPQVLYTITFSGAELWQEGDSKLSVSLDLFEPYLAAAF